MQDETFAVHSALIPSDPVTDYLSEAIHRLSLAPNLTNLYITGFAVISQSLFWPEQPNEIPPTWANLEWLEVDFDMKTPDGDWYFLPGPEGDDDDVGGEEEEDEDDRDEDELEEWEIAERREQDAAREVGELPVKPIRNIPDAEKLYPFFRAVAQAAARMPKLRYLCVKTTFSNPTRTYCEMWLVGPGLQCWHDAKVVGEGQMVEDVRKRWRLYWNVIGLELDEECLSIWKEGEARKGRELAVHVLSR